MNALGESGLAESGLRWAVTVLVQATAVIAVAWLMSRSVGRRGAAVRHAVWLCALICVLASPATTLLMDRLGWTTLRVSLPAGEASQSAAVQPVADGALPASFPVGIMQPAAFHSGAAQSVGGGVRAAAESAAASTETAEAEPAATAPLSQAAWIRLGGATLLGLWAAVAAYLLARMLWRSWALRRLLLATRPADDPRVQKALETACRRLGVASRPRVLLWTTHGGPITPVTVGVVHPAVVLSSELIDTLADNDLADVLVHESAHAVRHDPLVAFLQRIAAILFWPYPPVALMNRELDRAREEVCDNYVLHCGDGPQYAQTLFDLAQRVVPLAPLSGRLAPVGLLPPCWRLEDRVAGLLDPRRNTMTRTNRCLAVAVGAAFLTVALLTAGVQYAEAQPQSEEAAELETAAPSPHPAEAKAPAAPQGVSYTCRVVEHGTGKPIAGATVTVRRLILAPYEHRVLEEPKYTTDAEGRYTFTIPPAQAAERFLYIELDVTHPNYATKRGFGYSFTMIRKNETVGERPFFEQVELRPAEAIFGTVVLPDGKPAAGVKVLGFSMGDQRDFESASFTDAVTDAQGAFRLNLVKGGDGVYWLLPKDFSPSTHVVLKRRGDQGKLALARGIVVKGRVVDLQKKPVAGVWVNARVTGGPAKKDNAIPVADMLSRAALSDANGAFTLSPLPASEYVIGVEKHPHDSLIAERSPRIPPALFGPQPMLLKEGETTHSVDIAALPEVVIEGQYYDSQGKTRLGHEPSLWGQMPGRDLRATAGFYNTDGKVDTGGKFILHAPKGLQKAKLQFITNEHSALRVRMKKGGPLSNLARDIDLGTLEHNISGVEVVRYEAPILLVKPLLADGAPAKGAKLEFEYAKDRSPMQGGRFTDGGDVHYERQPDGRLRSEQLLPDEEVTVTIRAEGCKPKTEKVKLAEGAVRELEVRLEKDTAARPPAKK